jgi:carotenoid cleavage dioxygenase
MTANPYLTGNFGPVTDERDDDALEVTGAVPPELDGLLLRNGPDPIAPDPAAYHWFVGDGMLHGIELRDGRARYRNRWVRTDAACEALGEQPPAGQPADVFPGGSSVANTHVVAHAGRIFALVEVALPTEVRADLSTVGRHDYGGRLRSPFTAHPKIDPVTGEMHFFGYDIMGPPYLRYHVAGPDGELQRSVDITIPGPSMVHDFAITEHNVVFLDLPVVYDLALLGRQPFPASWDPAYGARVGVMPRDGGDADVRWSEIDLCYVYHPMNAYDDGDRVVLDVVRWPEMFATDPYGPGASAAPTLDRWTIDPAAGKVIEERLDDRGQEFPRIDERRLGRRHRFGYAAEAEVSRAVDDFGQLLQHDLDRGAVARHDFGPGTAAGEPLFVPSTPDAAEDEGWVLSVVYDATRDSSDLVILDATDFAGPAVATVHLRRRVPFGFHGSWVAGASLG